MKRNKGFSQNLLVFFIDKDSLTDEQKKQGIGMVHLMLDAFQKNNLSDADFTKCCFNELKNVITRASNFILATFGDGPNVVANIMKRYGLLEGTAYHSIREMAILNKCSTQNMHKLFKEYLAYIRNLYFVSNLLYQKNPTPRDRANLYFLHLPNKVLAALSNGGFNTLGDLLSLTYSQFNSRSLVSNYMSRKILSRLTALGFEFKSSNEYDEEIDICDDSEINLLNIPSKTISILNQNGIFTVKQLTSHSSEDLRKIEGITRYQYTQVCNSLKKHGYTLHYQTDELKTMPINKLNLSTELIAKLNSIGVRTCFDLLQYFEYDLFFDLRFDMHALNKIISELRKYHLHLKKKYGLYSADREKFIEFSSKAFHVLMNNNIYILEQLCSYSFSSLLKIHGMGIVTATEIRDTLSNANVTLN